MAFFLVSAAAYLGYTLYFCQMTMLHGDEGEYLRITQSLIHDGDMDLSNNMEQGFTREFHPVEFPLVRAPSSPTGRTYAIHSIGLSVVLLPAYGLALDLFGNPRLGCALFMAVLTAFAVAAIYVFLRRMGFSNATSCVTTICGASTPPLFTHFSQIYPEVPGMVIALLSLASLAHWLVPKGRYRDPGSSEPLLLAGIVTVLACPPFLHPRMIFMALPSAGLVLLQAWSSRRRGHCLLAIALPTAVGIGGLLLQPPHQRRLAGSSEATKCHP